jgi:diacylglycerol kinase
MVTTGICLISMSASLEILNTAVGNTVNGELTNFDKLEYDMVVSYKKLKFH